MLQRRGKQTRCSCEKRGERVSAVRGIDHRIELNRIAFVHCWKDSESRHSETSTYADMPETASRHDEPSIAGVAPSLQH